MPDIHKINEDDFFKEPEKKSFWDHFDNNIMEFPKSWWRKAWGWKPLYWLRCHTFTKYHMIDCRNSYYDAGKGYDWGWIDRSHILLIANFNILVEFIEKEHPNRFIDWESDPDHSHAWSEMMDLYSWWKTGRKKEQEALSAILDEEKGYDWDDMFEHAPVVEGGEKYYTMKELTEKQKEMYDRYNTEERRLEEKDQENLIRLIKIRQYMWT